MYYENKNGTDRLAYKTGKSKKKFCKKCGISERELQRLNYRNGQDNAEIILKISKATNVEVCDLYKNGD